MIEKGNNVGHNCGGEAIGLKEIIVEKCNFTASGNFEEDNTVLPYTPKILSIVKCGVYSP